MRKFKFRAFNKELRKMVYPDKNGWFHYVIRSKKNGAMQTTSVGLLMRGDYPEVELLEHTGLEDVNGVEIYEGDVLEVTHLWRRYKVVIKFGRYLQDGSGGEYIGNECIGFYAEAIHKDALDEDEFKIVREEMQTASILDYEDIVVLGNVYEHSHLLEGEDE